MIFKSTKKLLSFIVSASSVLLMTNLSVFAEKPVPSKGFASGGGTLRSPYIIETPEQLEFLAESTNNGNDYFGKYIKLKADLDFTSYEGDNNHTPIGTGLRPFCGNFDGAGHVIRGIRVNNPDNDYQGIFGLIETKEGWPVEIKRLSAKDGVIRGRNFVGGIIGSLDSMSWYNSKISDVANENNVMGDFGVGGIIGSASGNMCVMLVKNIGKIQGISESERGNMVGGIFGNLKITTTAGFYNIDNSGDVSGNIYVGGVAGYINSQGCLNMDMVYNFGNINGQGHINNLAGLITERNKKRTNIMNSSRQKHVIFTLMEDEPVIGKSNSIDTLTEIENISDFRDYSKQNIKGYCEEPIEYEYIYKSTIKHSFS